MTADEVSRLIANEIALAGEGWLSRPENNPHGLDLARCLIEPQRVMCANTFPHFRSGRPIEVWLVLEELPGNDDGYRIIFEDDLRKFGLACGTRSKLVFIGWHGTFLDTVQGM